MSRVKDGATLRHERVVSMLAFIQMSGKEGAALLEIQSYMLERFGLKFPTTSEYLRECALAGFIREHQGAWYVTDRYRKYRSEP